MEPQAKILCVDDEPRILEALARNLEWDYVVETARAGGEGLEILAQAQQSDAPVAVVVSDMRMPQMDGATFLSQVRDLYPEVTRMLLTGQADLESAMRAVNKGAIFRMLFKPCPREELEQALQHALQQNELYLTEKRLLDQTLKGSVEALFEALALASPLAFSRAQALRRYVAHMLEQLSRPGNWAIEIAAMGTQLGLLSVPEPVLEQYFLGNALRPKEQQMIDQSREVAFGLLGHVPRMEAVGQMIRHAPAPEQAADLSEEIYLGARLLHLARALDLRVMRGSSVSEARAELEGQIAPELLALLQSYPCQREAGELLSLPLDRLRPEMMLEADVHSKTGQLLVKKGQKVSQTMINRLRNVDESMGVEQPLLVRHQGMQID